MYNLVIVESPNKAETIKQYLSSLEGFWRVVATFGHFKNLPEKGISVKNNNGTYVGEFEISKKNVYENLKKVIKEASYIYIATDDDREGEAIAWDIVEEFSLDISKYKRVVFTEITKKSISTILLDTSNNNIDVKSNLVSSRYARRIIDRIVGYKLSSLLKYIFKTTYGLEFKGVGRVSYAAISILAKREQEIQQFESYNYRKLFVVYTVNSKEFVCFSKKRYIEDVENTEFYDAYQLLKNEEHIVTDYSTEFIDVSPPKPVTGSSLLANISYLYRYSTDKTSKIAQKLFEGVNINGEKVGLITYPRTDSYRISKEFAAEVIATIPYMVINKEDGPLGFEYVVDIPREYKLHKNSQDAHEALRPTSMSVEFAPHNVRKYLSEEEYRVYNYIYNITLSSFMATSSYIVTKINITCGDITLESETKEQVFDGWEVIGKYFVPFYKKYDKFDSNPPILNLGDVINYRDIDYSTRKAKRPDRYSEGGFIEILTSKGIGRPSTLPSIVPELKKKQYIDENKSMLIISQLVIKIVEWANINAPWIIDLDHAREFEEKLSLIENGELDRNILIKEYDFLIKELYEKFNFIDAQEYHKQPPTDLQVSQLKKIQQSGFVVPDKAFQYKVDAKKSIEDYFKSKEIAKCLFCKKGKIHNFEKYYKCNNKECDFIFWKSTAEKFVNHFNISLNSSEFILELLKTKKVKVENMRGKNVLFSANAYIEKNEKFGYQIGFSVVKN